MPRKQAPDPDERWRQLDRLARTRFGVNRFRPGQRDIIDRVLDGRDTLGILPTGGGKSLCYQLPALVLPRATVVVSPLIALMQDQQDKLIAAEIPAAKLDSTLTAAEEHEAVEGIAGGGAELVYVTPERLERPDQLELLRKAGVSLFVVDEAHCISQWGHDFRPAYLSLRDAIRALGRPPVLALTATATPEVAADILQQLDIPRAAVVNTGIERPGLQLEVFRTVNEDAKRDRLLQLLREANGPAIVYSATVRAANELHRWLEGEGVSVARYHGKLKVREREEAQQRFMEDAVGVMVATKAFGLGVDKPNVRLVVHYNFPESVETYYQEAGRAGRDGRLARAALLYRLEDKRIQRFFLGGKYPRREEAVNLCEVLDRLLAQDPTGTTARTLAEVGGMPERRVKVLLALLEAAGVVGRGRRIRKKRSFEGPEELLQVLQVYEERARADSERLETMMHYAQSPACRMRFLREYFAEDGGTDCGRCDNCRGADSSNRAAYG